MIRVCPNCKSRLSVKNYYFCSFCGKELPPELILKPNFTKVTSFVSKKRPRIPSKISTTLVLDKLLPGINIKSLFIGVAIGFSAIAFSLLIIEYSPKMKNLVNREPVVQEIVNPQSQHQTNTVNLNIQSNVGDFGQNNCVSFIPYEAVLYLELSDFTKLSEYFAFLGGSYVEVFSSLKEIVNPFSCGFLIKEGENYIWGFVFFPKDVENLSTLDFFSKTEEDVVYMSESEEVIKLIQDSKEGLSKNLGLHSKYISLKNTLPKEGKFFILALTQEGKTYVNDIIGKGIEGDFYTILKSFSDSNLEYLVIK